MLHLKEFEKPFILNSTNGQLIAKALNSDTSDNWTGKQIILWHDPNVSFGGKLVGGIRVKPAPAGVTKEPTEPDADSVEADIAEATALNKKADCPW